MPERAIVRERYLKARAEAFYSTSLPGTAMSMVGAIVIAGATWSGANRLAVGSFVAMTGLILVVRIVSLLFYRRSQGTHSARWLWWATALGVVSGLAWGAIMIWATRSATDSELLVMVCIGLGAVMMTISTVSFWPAHVAFHGPLLLGAAFGFATSGRPGHLYLGASAVLLFGAMVITGRRLGRQVVRAMRLSAENAVLAERLEEQASALQQANHALEQLSRTDALTGLANRRWFMERLDAHWARGLVAAEPIALIAIDVDRFKHYNDTYGHAAGDGCLKVVAAALASGARDATDLAARPGGEEFALLLPGADLDAAMQVAERVRLLVEESTRSEAAMLPAPATISLGVASFRPIASIAPRDLLEAADRALYRAKQAGRNRVAVDDTASIVAPIQRSVARR
ncbi:diguanylate cyclase [Sphingomonas sp. HITSZ_GF]|uniref:GGDEF domain-containing protein n=1 Tax=Sphingomonas sp. HITSZ_GF TaxID=3037247 RepID=UPI00240D4E07|nr:diguanylate cyclase [Sphingomonas sp. HITSZ_GF]MDG2532773.1 diguanylate cyclase [Sphingomonas sp. HITSZ_GF]